MVELEKQRMRFAKELECHRMQLFTEMQVRLHSLRRASGSKGPTSSASAARRRSRLRSSETKQRFSLASSIKKVSSITFKWVEDYLMEELGMAKAEIEELKETIQEMKKTDFVSQIRVSVMLMAIGVGIGYWFASP